MPYIINYFAFFRLIFYLCSVYFMFIMLAKNSEQIEPIKAAARAKGMTLKDIATALGLSPQSFHSQIAKRVSGNLYVKIAAVLGVPVDALKPRPSVPESSDIVAVLRGIIREKDETIRQQAEEIGRLRSLLQS